MKIGILRINCLAQEHNTIADQSSNPDLHTLFPLIHNSQDRTGQDRMGKDISNILVPLKA